MIPASFFSVVSSVEAFRNKEKNRFINEDFDIAYPEESTVNNIHFIRKEHTMRTSENFDVALRPFIAFKDRSRPNIAIFSDFYRT